jgi:hypothetical protein
MCATVLGDVMHAVGVENIAVDPVPIPVLAPPELREVALAESLRRHNVASFLHVIPLAGRESNRNSRTEGAASQATVE